MNRRELVKAMMGLPVATFTRIPADELKPSDVIVIETNGPLSQHNIELIKQQLTTVFPQHKIVVLGDGIKLRVVAAPPGAAAG